MRTNIGSLFGMTYYKEKDDNTNGRLFEKTLNMKCEKYRKVKFWDFLYKLKL